MTNRSCGTPSVSTAKRTAACVAASTESSELSPSARPYPGYSGTSTWQSSSRASVLASSAAPPMSVPFPCRYKTQALPLHALSCLASARSTAKHGHSMRRGGAHKPPGTKTGSFTTTVL